MEKKIDMLKICGPYKINGTIEVPGDKSISHRSIILSSLTKDKVIINNFLFSDDCINTLKILKKIGVKYQIDKDAVIIQGCGLSNFSEPDDILYTGNSGTSIRLLSGLLCGCNFMSILSGDKSVNNRPMDRIIKPLTEMGAKIFGRLNNSKAPIVIFGGRKLKGKRHEISVASAQVKSCLTIAALFADGITEIIQPEISRDHTERMLEYFGANIEYDGKYTKIIPGNDLKGKDIFIPGDFSSAAFFIVAAIILKNSKIIIKNTGINPTRSLLLDILIKMGAKIEIKNKRIKNNEEIADIEAYSSNLNAIKVDEKVIPYIIDEIPILSVAAAFAQGVTEIRGAKELRVKESDRIKSISNEFNKLGIKVKEYPDGLGIHGKANQKINSSNLTSYGDHRIAMSLAVLALKGEEVVQISNTRCINTSFPGFEEKLFKLISK
ncbi:MAG: 3-phosphoshikimate 1-carboxyvinyltransferase [Actinobacteria bacterium]|nr:3-phosphoshikimate 1-carboxyvinyltransferase [Actinomycetota bacterium]